MAVNGGNFSTSNSSQNYGTVSDFIIGGSISNTFNFDGNLQELIVYDTDKPSNRNNIEKNINDHYSIF